MVRFVCIFCVAFLGNHFLTAQNSLEPAERVDLALIKEISGNINPQDVIYSSTGYFFVPNSGTHHTTSVFDRTYFKVADVEDEVFLSDYFYNEYQGASKGAPFKGVATPDGKYVWISNYAMQGSNFTNPGYDNCISPGEYDPTFVYKVNTTTYQIQAVIKVGSVPSNLAISPNGRYLLVSSWCGGRVSIIDTEIELEKFNIPLGENPAGMCVNSQSSKAYVALTGENTLIEIDLRRGHVSRYIFKGRTPYSLQLGPSDRFLYVSYWKEGRIGKIDLEKRKIIGKVEIGKGIQDILLSPNGRYMYALDTKKTALIKLRTTDMTTIQRLDLSGEARGMALDPVASQLWVATENGINVFEDISMNGVRVFTPNPFVSRQDSTRSIEDNLFMETEVLTKSASSAIDQISTFHIIIGSFQTVDIAEKKKSALKSLGYHNCTVIPSESGRFRLSVEQYTDLTQATKDLSFYQENFDPAAWILDEREENP